MNVRYVALDEEPPELEEMNLTELEAWRDQMEREIARYENLARPQARYIGKAQITWKFWACIVLSVVGLTGMAVTSYPASLVWGMGMAYFCPTWFALLTSHKNAEAIFILNLLFGWTIIGWGVALIWANKK